MLGSCFLLFLEMNNCVYHNECQYGRDDGRGANQAELNHCLQSRNCTRHGHESPGEVQEHEQQPEGAEHCSRSVKGNFFFVHEGMSPVNELSIVSETTNSIH